MKYIVLNEGGTVAGVPCQTIGEAEQLRDCSGVPGRVIYELKEVED